jgi:hypothetical protein
MDDNFKYTELSKYISLAWSIIQTLTISSNSADNIINSSILLHTMCYELNISQTEQKTKWYMSWQDKSMNKVK